MTSGVPEGLNVQQTQAGFHGQLRVNQKTTTAKPVVMGGSSQVAIKMPNPEAEAVQTLNYPKADRVFNRCVAYQMVPVPEYWYARPNNPVNVTLHSETKTQIPNPHDPANYP